ncbi:MAG TPA: hypothetical protein VFA66_01765 [Gaiellaceae bacterium]|nr:hypothetical protein [Gaiellaceae bacterium]
MNRIRRYRPTPAMIVACLALAVALAGTSYAATALPRNSVGVLQLKNNSVTAAKVKNGTLLRADFKSGQLPVGPRGPAGPPGPAGPAGPAGPSAKWALVRADGTIASQSGGVTLTAKPAAGSYVLDFGTSLAGKLILTASANAGDTGDRGAVSVSMCGGTPEGSTCPTGNDTNHLRVITRGKSNDVAQDHPFYVTVIG